MLLKGAFDFLDFALQQCRVLLDPRQSIHVCVENLGYLENRLVFDDSGVSRVEVLDDLLDVLRHPLQLRVDVLGKVIRVFPFEVRVLLQRERRGVANGTFQRFEQFCEFALLRSNEVQLVVESLLVELQSLDEFAELRNLLSVGYQEAIPSVNLRGLSQEGGFVFFELQLPFVDRFFQETVVHCLTA